MNQSDFLNSQDPDLPYGESGNFGPAESQRMSQSLEELAGHLYLTTDFLEDVLWMLQDKRAIVLQGPPGTGKTYIGREIASYLAGSNVTFVQFHPSYSYEDFVAGFRPAKDADTRTLTYRILPGPLLNVIQAATAESEQHNVFGKKPHVLFIDEINRANLSKVFGELMFAMEYKNESVRLQYQQDGENEPMSITVPSNLLFIGTMNTADRSIASFDAAMRRRFHFIDCHPLKSPFAEVLPKYLAGIERDDLQWIVPALRRVNEGLADPAFAVGPSHFMGDRKISEEDIQRRWRYSVAPYLESRFGEESVPQTLTPLEAGDVAEEDVGASEDVFDDDAG